MDDDGGIWRTEELILDPLEESPQSLPELAWGGAEQIDTLLWPGLLSLAVRGLIEVRRFASWPAPWDTGVPVSHDELRRESARLDAWSEPAGGSVLAAHITAAGVPYL